MSSRSWRRWRGLPALVVGLVGLLPAVAGAATLSATPASFGSVFAGAQAGDTVVLAPGAYGTFYGAQKAGMVTVRAAAGATASMKVWFRPASNITLDGVTITDLEIGDAATKNIVVRDSSFDRAQAVVRTGELVNANVVFDHDSFTNFDKCSDCYEGRVELPEKTGQSSGVTIENSLFAGGNSDGIQNGGNGVRIVGNEFAGIHQVDGASGVHADSIQLYGSANTVVRGNYFHDVATGIMAADGADHELIEDNVFAVSGSPFAVDLESDNGSVFRHNTLLDHGSCDYGQRCGTLYVGNKSGDPASRGTVVSDNILTSICVCEGATGGFAQEDYNLFTNGSGSGAHDLRGTPTFLGGALPGTLAGFALAPGSLGKNNASDGTDRGATTFGAALPPTPTRAAARAGLVAAYGFDERSGSRAADASGNGHTGRIHGARRVRGHSGRGLWFDGARDFVSVRDAHSLHLRRRMTLEAWVLPAAGGPRWQPVLAKRRGPGASFALFASDRLGRPTALPRGARAPVRSGRRLHTRWTHLAVSFNGRWLRLYVDGRRVAQRRRSALLPASTGLLTIGAGLGHHFKGRIDDVRIYSRALAAGSIRHDMTSPV